MHVPLAALRCEQTCQKLISLTSHYLENIMHKSLKYKDRAWKAVTFHTTAICILTKSPWIAGTFIVVNDFKIKANAWRYKPRTPKASNN